MFVFRQGQGEQSDSAGMGPFLVTSTEQAPRTDLTGKQNHIAWPWLSFPIHEWQEMDKFLAKPAKLFHEFHAVFQ